MHRVPAIHTPADCPLDVEARRLQETLQSLLRSGRPEAHSPPPPRGEAVTRWRVIKGGYEKFSRVLSDRSCHPPKLLGVRVRPRLSSDNFPGEVMGIVVVTCDVHFYGFEPIFFEILRVFQ